MENLNAGIVMSAPLIIPPLDVQRDIIRKLELAKNAHSLLARHLRKQTELLRERRNALITAAVTGELDIPKVAA
jgi:type I restriction enzyme S subunit